MIISRKGHCTKCPPNAPPTPLIKGLCQYHYYSSLKLKGQWKKLEKDPDPELKIWYEHQISLSTWVCENCGLPIPHFSEEARYAAQAHILPKEHFPSVAKHPLNRLHLGNFYGCNCHNYYDDRFPDIILSSPALQIVQVRFPRFYPLINPLERKRIPQEFIQFIHPI